MENNKKQGSVLATVLTVVGIIAGLAAIAAALCVLYKKQKQCINKFNDGAAECEDCCEECAESYDCGMSDCQPEVECEYAEAPAEAE